MFCDKIELDRCRVVSQFHMTINVEVVHLLGIHCRPDTSISAVDDVSVADEVIHHGEEGVDVRPLSDLVVVKFCKISAHTHGPYSVAWVEAVEYVTSWDERC